MAKALDLLYRAMHAVLYCRIATAMEMASKGGGHVAHRHVHCVPGGRWGDTERVVARWRSLVPFMKALDLLKWPAMEVHLFAAAAYFDCCNRS